MSKPRRAVAVFDRHRQFLYVAGSIKTATEKTGLKYVTVQKASHTKSHKAKDFYIVPLNEVGGNRE